MRVLIIVVLIIIAGFFAYKYENTSKKLTGQVINGSSVTAGASVAIPNVVTVSATDNLFSGGAYGGTMFQGDLISTGGASTTTVGEEVGLTTAYGIWFGAPPMTAAGVFANSGGLTCQTTYHWRAKATNSAGTAYGLDKTFTTGSCTGKVKVNIGANNVTSATAIGNTAETTTTPTVTTYGSSSVTAGTAYLTGKLTGLGGASSATVGFNYGTTTSYGSTTTLTSPMTVLGAFNKGISGLLCGTTYNFRAMATTTTGTAYGANMTFTTTACSGAVVLINDPIAGSITQTSVKLSGTLLSLGGASSMSVGFEPIFPSSVPVIYVTPPPSIPATFTAPGDFSALVTGLRCGATYYTADHASIPGVPTSTIYSASDRTFTTLPC